MAEKFDLIGIHHINLLVRDLKTAKQAYGDAFNVEFIDEALPERGVLTSRFSVGESWLVLIEPIAEGEPMQQLRERGEGLFLLSLGVAQSGQTASIGSGMRGKVSKIRKGISDWRVADIQVGDEPRGQLQLAFCQTD
jgi:catechol 2,3-dioxygenase-like lactoylglutathione lyase family enzyme